MEKLNKINLEKEYYFFDEETLASIEPNEPVFIISSVVAESPTPTNNAFLSVEIALRKCERVGMFGDSNY